MNEQPQLSTWERTTTAHVLGWLFSWRGMRRILIVLAWTITIIALIYGEENWRGRRAWRQYRATLEKAHGAELDFKDQVRLFRHFIPKPVPDEQNFATTPFVQSWFRQTGMTQ